MTQNTTGEMIRNFQANDIKALVLKHGRISQGSNEIVLQEPSVTDPVLQSIVQDPKFTVKSVGTPTETGVATFELYGFGKTIKVKVGAQPSSL